MSGSPRPNPLANLECDVSDPKHTAQKGTLLFIHGLGDTGKGFFSSLKSVANDLGFRLVCPTAPIAPVSANGGMQMTSWFDMKGFDEKTLNDEKLDPCVGLEENKAKLTRLLDNEVDKLEAAGLSAKNLFLAGFSQGGSMSVQVGFAFPKTLGGISGFSAWAIKPSAFQVSEANQKTHCFLHHGSDDDGKNYFFFPLFFPSSL
jgi:phospholipase/carboxylesterase